MHLFSKKTFQQCTSFKLGESLLGIMTDWSDSEIRCLSEAVCEEIAKS